MLGSAILGASPSPSPLVLLLHIPAQFGGDPKWAPNACPNPAKLAQARPMPEWARAFQMGFTYVTSLICASFAPLIEDIIAKFGYDPKNETFLRIYYVLGCVQWAEWVPYSWPLTVYALLSNKLTWYSWNLADVLVLVTSRALYMKFKSLYERSEVLSLRVEHDGYRQGH